MTGICVILTLAKWCSVSDKYGRKFLFRAGMAGITLYILVNLFAATRFNAFGSNVYYLEAVVGGLMPLGQLINPSVFGYTADITPRNQRSVVLGLMAVFLAMGYTIGSALGAYFTKNAGDLTSVLRFALILMALLSMYLSIIPESLPLLSRPSNAQLHQVDRDDESEQGLDGDELPKQMTCETSHRWTLKRIANLAKECLVMIADPLTLFLPHQVPKSKNIATSAVPMLILIVNFLVVMAFRGSSSLFVPMTSLLFHWNAYDSYVYLTFMYVCLIIVYSAIFPALQAIYKAVIFNQQSSDYGEEETEEIDMSYPLIPLGYFSAFDSIKMDAFFSLIGLCVLILSHLVVPIFASVEAIYVAGAFRAFGITAMIALISLITSMVPRRLIGSAVGALSLSDTLAGTTADFFFGPLFSRSLRTWPLSYYYVSAGILMLALSVQSITWWSYHRKT
ncbi:MAG: major facilitator superfamily domain-containing protein [Linnemannia gamsii]|nr:MAG: major facilitator superfamily domain-containing protein [Linnemannia gamsii]